MKKLIRTTIAHPLIAGSAIIVSTSLIGSVFNFLFNLFMVQNLNPSDYGVMISLVSLTTLLTIPAGAISPSVIRFAAKYFASGNLDQVKAFFIKLFKICFVLAVISFVGMVVFRSYISSFFNIYDPTLFIIVAFAVFISFVGVINTSFLQAKLLFKYLSLTNVLSFLVKFCVGVGLIKLGFSVTGAMIAILLSYIIPYVLSFFPLKFLLKKSEKKLENIDIKEFFVYGAPAAIATFGSQAFISSDILLVKHFYSADAAGIYAAGLSLVGRVIFFISAPIAQVMFPLVVQRHTKGENYHSLLGLSVLLVFLPSFAITLFYFLFPHLAIQLIVKQDIYQSVAPLLGVFGIFISIYSILTVLIQFLLSINKTIIAYPIALCAILQVVLLWYIHGDYVQVIEISMFVVSLLLIILLLYYFQLYKAKPHR